MRISLSHGVGHAAAPNAASHPDQTVLSSAAFLALLRTRLGLTGPDAASPQRTAQFRALMATVGHPWYRNSFALDPWNTARTVLNLRDDAIAAGWTHDSSAASADSAAAQPRLAALAAIEDLVTVGSPRQARATLAPGPADHLRDVLDHLRRLVDGGHTASWPLGIERVDVADARDDLPPLWRTLLDLLADCGVDISWTEEAPFALADLTVSRGRDEWSTAESAARFLATAPDPSAVVIIAGDDTAVLDQQLRRRGLPTVGAAPTTAADPAAQLLPLFLTALIPPLDVHRIAELLALRITTDAEAAAGTQPTATRSVGLVPSAARSALLHALGQEAGISSDPESAWVRALDDLRTAAEAPLTSDPTETVPLVASATVPDPRAQSAWAIAQTLDEFLRADPVRVTDAGVHLDRLVTAVDWLGDRLRRLGGARPSRYLTAAAAHVSSFLQTIDLVGTDTLVVRELVDIVDACAPAATAAAAPAEAAPWTVVTAPSQVPEGADTVLWWSAHNSGASARELWDPHEVAALAAAGATITPAAQHERLAQAADLRGLSRATHVYAFHAETVGGEERHLHPALVHLAGRFAKTRTDLFGEAAHAVDDVLSSPALAHPVPAQTQGQTWSLRDQSQDVSVIPQQIPAPPTRVSRSLSGDFTHLLPERLSFTQIDRLLRDPLSWTLRYGLNLSAGLGALVPTDNRMLGLLVHAVVEHLVVSGAADDGAVPTRSDIQEVFDRFVPRFASELLLPGSRARLESVRTTTLDSLTELFRTLASRGLHVTGAETEFHSEITLDIAGVPLTIGLTGFRDLDAQLPDGRPAVIDLKWTYSPRTYREAVNEGEAVQLSIYSQALDRLDTAPLTAYYMLKQGVFVSADQDLDRESRVPGDPAHLWPRIQRSVQQTLTQIARGTFDAPAADTYLATDTGVGHEKKPFNDALAALREAAQADGRLLIQEKQQYSDVTGLYGLLGDYS
ncbi:PD-(D/E)XK nuclease family protein [Brevibacterium senegalense]|uniref:PD-(D/E)XK nuclease family protein n=1 Tax=Brevibacterium senegalense TaxID=1033736 RepID=UPI000364FB11|nr:PD-(D/E)XK nuclease family protein [Brevibacterium senegalense]